MFLIAAAVVCGWTGWSGEVLLLPLALIFPALWAHAPSRLVAGMVSAGYFLAASRGLPQGVLNFYGATILPGILLWLTASTAFIGVHAAAWTRREERDLAGWRRSLRYLAAMVVLGLPPFGITGWAQPITSAGVLFPEWGWWGLVAAAAGLAMMTSRYWPASAIALGGLWMWSAAYWTEPDLPQEWAGIDLKYDRSLGRDATFNHHRDLIATVRQQAGEGSRVVVLPESALGFWTPTVARLWQDGLRDLDVIAIAGAAAIDVQGYDNVMVAISGSETGILYRQRMPVPVAMWQPWLRWAGRSGGTRAHILASPVGNFAGIRIAPLICYEQLLLWPFLQSMVHSPDIVVATGNGWWAADTSIVAIQLASAAAWAKLFGLPLVTAFNT